MRVRILMLALCAFALPACSTTAGVSIGVTTSCLAADLAYAEYTARHGEKLAVTVAYSAVSSICKAPPDQRAAMEAQLVEAFTNLKKAVAK